MQNSTENNKKISLEKMNQAILEQTDQVLASPISEIRKNQDSRKETRITGSEAFLSQ